MIPVWIDRVFGVESCPPTFYMLKSYPPVLQNMTLFRNTVIEDVIS